MGIFESFLIHTLHGIQFGFVLFLFAAGITIVLGILGVLNIAHGEFYAVGAYIGAFVFGYLFSVLPNIASQYGLGIFVLFVVTVIVLSSLPLIPIGAALEVGILKPLYRRDEIYQLLATFALLLIISDAIKFVFGPRTLTATGVYQTVNEIKILHHVGISYPSYNFIIILMSGVLAVLIFWFFNNTKTGIIIRATGINREIAETMGVNVRRIFILVFAGGAFLAGLAGGAVVPTQSANLEMGIRPLILSFVVIVVGGLGRVKGAFIAAMVVGLLVRWSVWLYPPAEQAAPYLVMVIILIVKPEGLYGTVGELE